jgi:hypothetical protein
MTKLKEKDVTIIRAEYTPAEIEALWNEVNHDISHESRNRWLIKHHAIRMGMQCGHEDIIILRAQDGSFPYTELTNKWEALLKREAKKTFAQGKQAESYEQVMNSVPKDLFNI